MCISDYIQTTFFFYLGRFLKKLAEDQCSLMITTVATMSNIMSKQPCTMHGSGLTRNWTLMEVSVVLYLHILHFYFVWQQSACKTDKD